MSELFRSLWAVVLIALTIACSSDDPLPKATVNFKTNAKVVEVGIPVMFDNLSLNADRYEWRFGTQTSTDISPSVTFKTSGDVEVVLKAFTKDNQVDSVVKTISVKQRYLTGYIVNVFPTKNGESDWDDGEASPSNFPDIVVQFLDSEQKNGLSEGPFANVKSGPFGRIISDNGFPTDVILTNQDWTFTLFDFDGADGDQLTENNTIFITGVQFNPVTTVAVKNEDENLGRISIFLQNTTGLLDIDIAFELK